MAYTTPVTDRTAADILAQNAKAYLNLVDWNRIYGNAEYLNALILTVIGAALDFNTLGAADTSWIITAAGELNPLLENIETMRLWAETYIPGLVDDPLFVEIKDDWTAGFSETSPNYTHVNSWEKVMDILNDALAAYQAGDLRQPRTGVALCGAGLTRQNGWRG